MQDFDLSLQNESPCVNTGTPDTSSLYIPTLDYIGNPRIFGNRIDMGAIENQWVIDTYIEQSNLEFSIFPNPTNSLLIFNIIPMNAKIEIIDMKGSVVLSQQMQKRYIDVSTLPAGTYFVRASHNQLTWNKKFIKE